MLRRALSARALGQAPEAANGAAMRSSIALALSACAVFAVAAGARGQESPLYRLARQLGTPKLGYQARNDAHTNSTQEFVRANETVNNWTKLFTVVATSVSEPRTQAETSATIYRLHDQLVQHHAKISAYDVKKGSPASAYFSYVIQSEIDVGVVFSPARGIVTVQQVAAHRPGVITPQDVRHIKALIGYPG
jgi:hypothetical protein